MGRAPGLDAAKSLPSFVSLEAFVAPGEAIERTVDLFTQAASIVLVHKEVDVVAADVEVLRCLESQPGGMFEVMVVFNDTPPPQIDTLPLRDAPPI